MSVLAAIRRAVLRVAWPLAVALARVGHLVSRGGAAREGYPEHAAPLRVGDAIVTRTRWAPTNLLIPGHYKHAAMYVGDGDVVEAVYPVVRVAQLDAMLGRADDYAVLRPRALGAEQERNAASVICAYVRAPYDFAFEPGARALYCSEAVWMAYRAASPDWTFEARERMGVLTVTPNDFYEARDHFSVVYEERAAA